MKNFFISIWKFIRWLLAGICYIIMSFIGIAISVLSLFVYLLEIAASYLESKEKGNLKVKTYLEVIKGTFKIFKQSIKDQIK